MDKPRMVESITECNKCQSSDNVSMCTNINGFERAIVTWCECGHIEVKLAIGMDVEITRM